jgi:hypothetical protein
LRSVVKTQSDDPDVQGTLLYMYCTGHRVLEFAALMDAELPGTVLTAGETIHLFRATSTSDSGPRPDIFVYDGWVDLPDASPESVAQALQVWGGS